MDTRRFYCENTVNDSILDIEGEEAYHLKKVLRAKIGTKIEITNGHGVLYSGSIDGLLKDKIRVKVEHSQLFKNNNKNIVIAPSLLKRHPMNLLIEKLSEIGISEITPVIFNRTEIKAPDKIVQKWEKIAISSLKVNKQVWLTKINAPLSLKDLIKKYKKSENKVMLDINGVSKFSRPLGIDTVAVIGPPGDYTKSERDELIDNIFLPVKINSSILKVETAAISISAILKDRELFPEEM